MEEHERAREAEHDRKIHQHEPSDRQFHGPVVRTQGKLHT
jgi:hypothetical protein